METTIMESPQAQPRQKANIELKIELPNSEKPFFNKLATESNMISQVKKAGTKLAENETLTVSVADRIIHLTKEETGQADLKSAIQEKLIDREINKGSTQKANSIQEFEGERNGVYQKLWVTSDKNNQLYSSDSLEYSEKDGKQVVDADLTKWKPISNETYSKIDDEMQMKGVVNLEVVGDVSTLTIRLTKADIQEVGETERSATAQEITARNFHYEMGFDKRDALADKNLNFLKDQLKYLGFGEDPILLDKLTEELRSPSKNEFSLSTTSDKTSFQNKIVFDLHFYRSETDIVFFNKFDARLTNEKKGVELEHTFAVKNNGFTAKQAINLLEGRAVKTEIKNPASEEKEPAFVKLKLNEPKNENGNFKLQVFNKNYGVDTARIVDRSSLAFKDEKHKEITIKSLEKGNIVAVKFKFENKEQEGKAILNPQYKTLNLYDQHMKRLNTNAHVLESSEKEGSSHQVKAQQYQSRKL